MAQRYYNPVTLGSPASRRAAAMKAWRAGALGRLRSEPFGDRLFRLRGFSRRPRLGVGNGTRAHWSGGTKPSSM
jgi:hypothetical protein